MKKTLLMLVFLIFSFSNIYSVPRKVVFEFSTSTHCMYCACMDSVINKHILVSYPQTIVFAYHGNELPAIDPYSNFIGNTIRDSLLGPELGFSAPMAFVDRSFWYRTDYPHAYDTVAFRYSNMPNSPVEIRLISKTYNYSTRELTVTAEIKAVQNLNGQFRVNFVITENNLIYYQAAGPCYGGGNNYDHDWVARAMANGWEGEILVNGNWNANQTFTKTFNFTLDTGWVPVNCDYSIFVYKRNYDIPHSEVLQGERKSVTGQIGIKNENSLTTKYFLMQNYPNPFNPVTNIKFSIPKSEDVSLKIYNITGCEVFNLFEGRLNAGIYNAEFNSAGFPSGVYYYVLKAGAFTDRKKMVVLK